jgi:hypothetical protein
MVLRVFRMDSHRLAPFPPESASFQGGKTIAIALFSREFAFSTTGATPPFFEKPMSPWKSRCFCISDYHPAPIAMRFCQVFQRFTLGAPHQSGLSQIAHAFPFEFQFSAFLVMEFTIL